MLQVMEAGLSARRPLRPANMRSHWLLWPSQAATSIPSAPRPPGINQLPMFTCINTSKLRAAFCKVMVNHAVLTGLPEDVKAQGLCHISGFADIATCVGCLTSPGKWQGISSRQAAAANEVKTSKTRGDDPCQEPIEGHDIICQSCIFSSIPTEGMEPSTMLLVCLSSNRSSTSLRDSLATSTSFEGAF